MLWSQRVKIFLQHPLCELWDRLCKEVPGTPGETAELAFLAGCAHVDTAGASGKAITGGEKELGIFTDDMDDGMECIISKFTDTLGWEHVSIWWKV